jgi:predicted enzyme related to lactoylglutathione lyase
LAVTIRIECLSIDAHDPAAQAQWWSEALGWRITEEDGDEGEYVIAPTEGTDAGLGEILFIRVPEDKAVKNRLHLDLRPDDQAAEVARFEQLGARHVDVGQTPEHTWVVLADPEGNEFCILRAKQAD